VSEEWLCEHGVWNSRDTSCNKCNDKFKVSGTVEAVLRNENRSLRDELEMSKDLIKELWEVAKAARFLLYLKRLKEKSGPVQEYVECKDEAWEGLAKAMQPLIQKDNEQLIKMIQASPGIGYVYGPLVMLDGKEPNVGPNETPPGENPGGHQPA